MLVLSSKECMQVRGGRSLLPLSSIEQKKAMTNVLFDSIQRNLLRAVASHAAARGLKWLDT